MSKPDEASHPPMHVNGYNVLDRALAQFEAVKDTVAPLAPAKTELLSAYDVANMDRAVGVCYWGRSGSRLLMSFLDGHDQVVMLPMECSQRIYECFVVHAGLSLREKLLAYPGYVDSYTPIFAGEFPIAPSEYYAAVDALLAVYGDRSSDFLSSSRTFFQFVHVAYALALGHRPATPRPLMVYAQHRLNYHTARFMKDFPDARFLHTVRDPISSFDSMFAFYLKNAIDKGEIANSAYPMAALRNLIELATTDCANRGLDERTRAVRFEDMHVRIEPTMRAVAAWLNIPYEASLRESTFNGTPWVVSRGKEAWSGARPAQAKRQSPNMWPSDRAMVYALFHEDFLAWDYRHPALFARPLLRRFTIAALWLIPTKIELLNAAAGFRYRIMPHLRAGQFRQAAQACLQLVECHRQLMKRLRKELRERLSAPRVLLQVINPGATVLQYTKRRSDPDPPGGKRCRP